MSLLTKFFTFEVMENATIENVSSTATGHPAEHAISPLEPNFAWEANEASAQHTITIDLGEIRSCDGFIYRHHESEAEAPPVNIGLLISAECSSDNTTWESISLSPNDDGSSSPTDIYSSSILFKMKYFVSGTTLIPKIARYFRFTLEGSGAPNFYAPTDSRVSILWLFNFYEFDKGSFYPVADTTIYPTNETNLPYGKVYKTGLNVNPHIKFSKTWAVTAIEYEILLTVLSNCNGSYRPFLFVEYDETRRLCYFESDQFEEMLIDTDLYRITCRIIEIPIIQKGGIH